MARQENANLLILGWKGYSTAREAIFGSVVDQIVANAPCDLFFVRVTEGLKLPFKRIMLPTAGGPSARFAARTIPKLLDEDGSVMLCAVVPEGADEATVSRASQGVADTIADLPFEVPTERRLFKGRSIPATIIKEAKSNGYDAIVVGATNVPWFKNVMFGKIPEQIARYSPVSVILAKNHEGAKTWVSRFLGRA
jgi:nucleotide-binding universal stress UspA family protein